MDTKKIKVGHKEECNSTEDVKYRMGSCFEKERNVTLGDQASNSTHLRGNNKSC